MYEPTMIAELMAVEMLWYIIELGEVRTQHVGLGKCHAKAEWASICGRLRLRQRGT